MMMLAFTVQFSRYGRSLRPGRRVPQLTPRTYLDASGEAVRRDAGPGRVHRRVISRGYPPSVPRACVRHTPFAARAPAPVPRESIDTVRAGCAVGTSGATREESGLRPFPQGPTACPAVMPPQAAVPPAGAGVLDET